MEELLETIARAGHKIEIAWGNDWGSYHDCFIASVYSTKGTGDTVKEAVMNLHMELLKKAG